MPRPGGAGVQADLGPSAALGVHRTSSLTCVTAQNPRAVRAIQACRSDIAREQLEAVFAEVPPAAVKTGMLLSASIIRVVRDSFRRGQRPPLIVDPVMVATSGARVFQPAAIRFWRAELLPLAALVTPNLPEAVVLTGSPIQDEEGMRRAARELYQRHGCAALIKGGHVPGAHILGNNKLALRGSRLDALAGWPEWAPPQPGRCPSLRSDCAFGAPDGRR